MRAALPSYPAEMKRRFSDALGIDVVRRADGEYYYPDSVLELREAPRMRSEFIGSDEEWAALPSDRPAPPELRERLWAEVTDEDRQRRAEEVIAACDRYNAEVAGLEKALGYDTARDAADEAYNLAFDLEEKILGLAAKTVDGFSAKARIVRSYYDRGLTEEALEEEERHIAIALSIVRDLEAVR